MKIIEEFGNRIHFLHLRNIKRDTHGIFQESEHSNGDNPMGTIIEKIILMMNNRGISLPMGPDYYFLHDFEGEKEQFVDYSLIRKAHGFGRATGIGTRYYL